MSPRARVVTGAILVLTHVATACTSWRVPPVSPEELISREHPSAIQVREHGGGKYVLTSPRLEQDSLTGYVKRVERRVPMMTIDRVAVRRFSPMKTVGLIVGVPAAIIAVFMGIYGIGCATSGGCSSFAP